jgi:CDP-glucose 4,6-dehydratase
MEVKSRRPDPRFWRDKRVLVTGHSGFKGSWLCMVLESLGAQVHGLSLPPGQPSLFELARVDDFATSTWGDVRDYGLVQEAMESFRPEVVLHLAAQALVRRGHKEPLLTFSTNATGTANVLEASRTCAAVQAALIITTDKVYRQQGTRRAFVETDVLGGDDPYSSSKSAAEIMTASYRSSYFKDAGRGLATARAGNVIGGGDWSEDRIIPDAVRAWSKGDALEVRKPDAVRPWQHVLEPVCGYLCLAEELRARPEKSSDFNFGPDDESAVKVKAVVELAQQAFGGGAVKWGAAKGHLPEAEFLSLSNTKARAELGVKPVWDLETSVTRTMRWYRQQIDGACARRLCDADLAAFLSSP